MSIKRGFMALITVVRPDGISRLVFVDYLHKNVMAAYSFIFIKIVF